MADGVLKVVYPLDFGCPRQLLLNKFFDPSTPSMRKGDDGEKGKNGRGGEENKDVFSGHNAIASRPPERQLTGTLTAHANISGWNKAQYFGH